MDFIAPTSVELTMAQVYYELFTLNPSRNFEIASGNALVSLGKVRFNCTDFHGTCSFCVACGAILYRLSTHQEIWWTLVEINVCHKQHTILAGPFFTKRCIKNFFLLNFVKIRRFSRFSWVTDGLADVIGVRARRSFLILIWRLEMYVYGQVVHIGGHVFLKYR